MAGWGPTEWAALAALIAAIAAFIQAAITLRLVILGRRQVDALKDQVTALKEQNRRWHTLTACKDFMSNPMFLKALRRLRKAKENGQFRDDPSRFRPDVVAILNYLDSVAIGVHQGLYVENLARDHLQALVEAYVRDYLKDGQPAKIGLNAQNFRYLLALEVRWSAISRPMFHDPPPHDDAS
ncbi:MAG: DUF4760 domain-containing protein [Methyloceanibacter sp.]|uniref:DUF4760 domain-containing protein n=1 Tax=Methyloceanibacter sp. TaxID=1965321 RepID=UPI003D6D6C66